jgi:hypothetical protein
VEALTRLLPKISQLDSVGHSTVQGLTSADIAAALSNCSDIGFLAIKRRHLDDKQPCSGYYRIYSHVVKIAQRSKWKHRNKAIGSGQLRKLLDICLDDYFELFKCSLCRGKGITQIDDLQNETCTQCHGQKLRQRYGYERAIEMGISKHSYSRSWKERHKQVMDYLDKAIPNEERNATVKFYRLMKG